MNNFIKKTAWITLFCLAVSGQLKAQGLFNDGTKLVATPGCNLILTGPTMNFTNLSSGSANGTFELSGNFYLQGSWFNNSNAILNMSPYAGNVYFNGNDTQLITHSSLDKYSIFYGLTLGSGAIVKVPAAKAVTVSNNFSTTGGTFILKSDSAHGTASLIDNNGGNNTKIISERWIMGRLGYHFLSSPVKDSPTDSIWVDNGNYWFYTYDERMRSDTNRDKGWIRAFPGQIMATAKGYSSVFKKSKTLQFTNPVISGNPTVTVYLTNFTDSIKHDDPNGWNLLGNPFPSAIDADAFINDNSIVTPSIEGPIYLWDDADLTINRNSDYAVYCLSGGAAAGSNPFNAPTRKIAVGQGFFVRKYIPVSSYPTLNNTVSSTVTFNRTQRVHEFVPQFFIPDMIIKQKIWLDLSCPAKSLYNEILVSCLNGATDAYDIAYDAKKLRGNADIAFYSICGNMDYAIQGLPPLNGERKSIPIGIDVNYSGNYTIKPYFESFDDANRIYLEDKLEKKMINLRTNSEYNFFIAQKGIIRDRFVLHFNPDASAIPTNENPVQIKVTTISGNLILNINSTTPIEGHLYLLDMTGKILLDKNQLINGNNEISLGRFAQGCYLIRFTSNDFNFSRKVLIP